ncbi:melanization protease 1-like [Trichogramma pretiosum]|uniref:melanization protease 1-like n=1 Tax=Trichogramma pretiosum TaxID=7493 RepID=UPI0006C9A4B7|nr:melanization protease 1-like [Trichogramma pretiosum]
MLRKIVENLTIIILLQPLLYAELTYGIHVPSIDYHPSWRKLSLENCGTRRFNGSGKSPIAAMGEYPWFVRLGYLTIIKSSKYSRKTTQLNFRCIGSIISDWFILTAAHCVVSLPSNMRLNRIRVGDHNLVTNPDCEGAECNDPYVDHQIAKVIAHEKFNGPVKLQHDIALVMVTEPIEFTEWVRPICLPRGSMLGRDFIRDTIEVSGWAEYHKKNREMSDRLLKAVVSIIKPENCNYQRMKIDGKNQYCVGGGKNRRDACLGDSGGPLMKFTKTSEQDVEPRFYNLGIVSFGPGNCGAATQSVVYTRTASYISWILNNLY